VPLLSWTDEEEDGNCGSVGDLVKLKEQDKMDKFLLSLTIALALRNDEKSAVRAIFPVLIGPTTDQGDCM
jgi:hypothetical protein